jgi:tetratricopeptide (TPR) repeat protein
MVYSSVGKSSAKKSRRAHGSEHVLAKSRDRRTDLSPRTLLTVCALVAMTTFVVFLPALRNDFVNWDDNTYVYENASIRSINATLFKSAFGGFTASNWHPLTWISHAIDYSIWGLNPLGHHLTNIILHALNTFMETFLILKLMECFRKKGSHDGVSRSFLNDRVILIAGAAAGLLSGLHPLNVESVAWVSERKDLLCALFFSLSIISYIGYIDSVDSETVRTDHVSRSFNRHYFLTLAFFVLALLSKPMAVTLPFVLLILDWYPFARIQSFRTLGTAFLEKIPFIVLSSLSSMLTILAQKEGGAMLSMGAATLSTRLLVSARSLIAYLWKMILPLDLVPIYPYPKSASLLSLEYLFPVVLCVAVTLACVVAAKKQRLWLAVWSYYLLALFPVLGIVQVGGQAMADRYTYLPSLGPFLVMGLGIATAYDKVTALRPRRIMVEVLGIVAAAALLILMSYATVKQIGVWKNSLVFWKYIIEKEPRRIPVAHNNLGLAYRAGNLPDMAIEQFQTALRIRPDYPDARVNLGNVYVSKGQFDSAIEQYEIALRLVPDYEELHNNLGVAYASKGKMDRAIEHFQTSLRIKPDYPDAHMNLGNAYAAKGQLDRAIEQYKKALLLKPDYADAHKNLGIAYLRKGLRSDAIRELKTAVKINPGLADVRHTLESLTR